MAVGIYLALNAGSSSAHGWGVAMSTDTAFALGALALVGPRHLDRLRVFVLTMVVVDDILGLAVIAVVYPEDFRWGPLALSLIPFAAILALRQRRLRIGVLYLLLGGAAWLCFEKSGVDPVVVGLVMGMLVFAYTAPRSRLERATERFRAFREQPTAELARSASTELRLATSCERAAAAALPPLDELRDRPDVRAREHRHRGRPRPALASGDLAVTLGILPGS